MQLDHPDAEGSVALGAYWNDQEPAAPYRILPSIRARLARVLIVLAITVIGVFGIIAGFVAMILPP
jgi:hypothetical protein